ncbi:hypothetical protein Tco_0017120 [Tanacetum coccineum]
MTGNFKLLCNFVEKFLGTVRFGNDQFARILGYGDLNQGNVMIKCVYYVELPQYNVSRLGQFCDAGFGGLVPQGKKASDYDNFGPVPPRQNVVPIAEKIDSSHQGLEFLFSPLIEEYYTPTHGLIDFEESFATVASIWRQFRFSLHMQTSSLFQSICMERENGIISYGPLKEEVYVLSRKGSLIQIIQKEKLYLLRKSLYGLRQDSKSLFEGDTPLDQSCITMSKIRSHMYLTYSRPELCKQYAIVHSFSDADHAGCIDTRKSTYGGIQFLGIMPTKIELTLEQSQQGVSNDVLASMENFGKTQMQDGKTIEDNDKGSKSRSQSIKEQTATQ